MHTMCLRKLWGDDIPWADLSATNAVTTRYLRNGTTPFARMSGTSVGWFLRDRLGSVREITDQSGVVIKSIIYDGFGRIIDAPGTGDMGRFLYTGLHFDSTTYFYFAWGRVYYPHLGRWMQDDPIGFGAGDTNLSRYVGNNATNATDPSGLADAHDMFSGVTCSEETTARVTGVFRLLFAKSVGTFLVANAATPWGAALTATVGPWVVDQSATAIAEIVDGRHYQSLGANAIHRIGGNNLATRVAAIAYDLGPATPTVVGWGVSAFRLGAKGVSAGYRATSNVVSYGYRKVMGRSNAQRGAASVGESSATATPFLGEAPELINGLRASKSRWIHRVADHVEAMENVQFLDDIAFAEALVFHRLPANATSAYTNAGNILLKRSRGYKQLVKDLAHEGTHSMDFRQVGKGMFAGETPGLQFGEEAFIREFRGYYAERLVYPHASPMTRGDYDELVRFILKEYPGSVKPHFFP